MYEQEVQGHGISPVENGEFMQGTWNGAFRNINLLDIHRPYPLHLPRWIRKSRFKEWESFVIQNGRYHLDAFLANLKYFRIAQLVLYDKESGERFRFRKILPFSGWRLPKNLYNDSIDSRSGRFFFRIHNWLDADRIKVDLNIAAKNRRPAFTAHLVFNAGSVPLVTTTLRENLPVYSHKMLCPVQGDMVWGGTHIAFRPEETTGFFRDCKGFYPYLSLQIWCTAAGFDEENRRCGFSINEQPVRGSSKNSGNVFWINGEIISLPPVHITMPQGINKPWVIQDLEGMVDLTFTPRVPARSAFNALVLSADYQTQLGFFTGFLLNSKEERIHIRGLWGLGEKLLLQV